MSKNDQVLRFAVGSPDGPRSRTWRIWTPRDKSDVYVSGRSLGSSVKVSLHEPGPSIFALTKEWVERKGFQAPPEKDRRLSVMWDRPRPSLYNRVARPLTIIVPWDEVIDRKVPEKGAVIWVPPPATGKCIHIDLVYIAAGTEVIGYPGSRSMGTKLVGNFLLNNDEQVFITSLEKPIDESLYSKIRKLRAIKVLDHQGKQLGSGMFTFGTEKNPDADDGSFVGVLLDVTLKPEQ